VPKLVGVPADISNPQTPIPLILESLRKHFNGKVDIVIFNAAVMGLARMGEGSMTADFVDVALLGNVKFPIMLMESFVKEAIINKEGRVVSISSEGVRAKRPPGG
jgi:3-oxoacyl-[acyl-carrier protein] reductase